MGINQTLSSHIPRNFKRFSIKPTIGIATFLGTQIARNHIPKIWMLGVMWIPPYQKPHTGFNALIVRFANANDVLKL